MKTQTTFHIKTGSLLVLILLFISSLNMVAQEFSWNQKTPMLYPGLCQSACFYDGKIYLSGGSKDGVMHNGEYGDSYLQIYNIATDTWTEGALMPTARWMHGSAVVGSVIYSIGGGWNNPLATNEAYDVISGTWSVKAPMKTPRSALGVAAVDNKIYAIGGFGSYGMINLNQMYNPETDEWKIKKAMQTSRCAFGTAVVDGKIYVIGGCSSPTDPMKTVEVYDPQTNTWQNKQDMPTARFGLVAAPVGKKIYAIGGTPSNVIPSPGKVEVYDIETDTWEILHDLPDSTQWGAGGSWNNRVYIMGGEDMCLMTYPTKATIFDFLYESELITGIEDSESTSKTRFTLGAYPNPFDNETAIKIETPDETLVKIEIFNSIGIIIKVLDNLNPQRIKTLNLDGSILSPGIYFCRLSSLSRTATLKLIKI